MDNKRSKLRDKPKLPTKLKLENTMDASGMWFAAAVLFAVLAAGIIVYRAANDDIIRTASNDTLTEAITLPHNSTASKKPLAGSITTVEISIVVDNTTTAANAAVIQTRLANSRSGAKNIGLK